DRELLQGPRLWSTRKGRACPARASRLLLFRVRRRPRRPSGARARWRLHRLRGQRRVCRGRRGRLDGVPAAPQEVASWAPRVRGCPRARNEAHLDARGSLVGLHGNRGLWPHARPRYEGIFGSLPGMRGGRLALANRWWFLVLVRRAQGQVASARRRPVGHLLPPLYSDGSRERRHVPPAGPRGRHLPLPRDWVRRSRIQVSRLQAL
ncbi:MAG: hypothetical protein AVDCRST_MAG93-5625, partial [uncultured Chloroflexia bacterium]